MKSVQDLQIWIFSGAIGFLSVILGAIITVVANYLGKKIDKTVEVNERLIAEISGINQQIKSLFHSINVYEISMNDVEKRLRDLEIEHARNSGNCKK